MSDYEQGEQASILRARGSRLEPGEVEEIAFLAERGHRQQITDQQVLGLIETIHSLARRCSIRFQEAAELRAKLTEMIDAEVEVVAADRQALEEVTRQRDIAFRQTDDLIEARNDLNTQVAQLIGQRESLSRQVADAMGQLRETTAEITRAQNRLKAESYSLDAIADVMMRDSGELGQDGTEEKLAAMVTAVREIVQRRAQAGQ